jgi:hypothetical protein
MSVLRWFSDAQWERIALLLPLGHGLLIYAVTIGK